MKGISPLIAAVLLIAFTMAIAGIIATWSTTFSRQSLDKASETGECLASLDVSYANRDDKIILKIRNVGQKDVSGLRAVIEHPDESVNEYELKDLGLEEPIKPNEARFTNIGSDRTIDKSDPSLIGYWNLDEGTKDSSIYGNDGIQIGGIDCSAEVKGKIEAACDFDGVNDYIDFGNDEIFNTDSITITYWFKAEGEVKGMLVPKSGAETSWLIRLADTDKTSFQLNTEGAANVQTSTTVHEIDTWYHIGVTYDTEDMKVYVNGEEEAGRVHASPGPIKVTDAHVTAGAKSGGGSHYSGIIDEIYMWNRALDTDEMKSVFGTKPKSVEVFIESCPIQTYKISII